MFPVLSAMQFIDTGCQQGYFKQGYNPGIQGIYQRYFNQEYNSKIQYFIKDILNKDTTQGFRDILIKNTIQKYSPSRYLINI